MEQRLSLVTLGVRDLDAARQFYERLGWRSTGPTEEVVFFQAGGVVVGLWSRSELAADTVVEDSGGWGGITLAHNVGSREAVDALLEEAGVREGLCDVRVRRRSGEATAASSRIPTATAGRSLTTRSGQSPTTVARWWASSRSKWWCPAVTGHHHRFAPLSVTRHGLLTVPPLAIVSADVSRISIPVRCEVRAMTAGATGAAPCSPSSVREWERR